MRFCCVIHLGNFFIKKGLTIIGIVAHYIISRLEKPVNHVLELKCIAEITNFFCERLMLNSYNSEFYFSHAAV